MNPREVQLGLGLIGIGKPWGAVPHVVPTEAEAMALLEFAYESGIRYFDTAPSYGDGVSEERLGKFLQSLGTEERANVTGATKFGERWNGAVGEPYVDHSFDALRRSLERSVERMGRVDVLQLHKTTPAALESEGVARAWDFATSRGIRRIGASVSDLVSARITLADPEYSVMQMPYNASYTALGGVFEEATARGMWIAVNRPFAMGAIGGDKRAAFRFILARPFRGVILSGTTSREHLRENLEAFAEAAQ